MTGVDVLLLYAGLAVIALMIGIFANLIDTQLARIASALEVLADKARHP